MSTTRRKEPLRYQIRDELLELFSKLKFKTGDKLPTEQDLGEMLNASRSTLREGLHLLEEERVILTKHGTGRFLLHPVTDFKIEMTRLQSVTEQLATFGIQGEIEVLDVSRLPSDGHISKHLQIDIGTPVIAIERLRKADNVPIIYSLDLLPESKLPSPTSRKDFEGSLFNFLEDKCKVFIDHSYSMIRTPSHNEMMNKYLISEPEIQWILLEQVSCISSGEPYIYSHDYHNGDVITFHLRRFRN